MAKQTHPVCRCKSRNKMPPGKTEYEGTTYYFCSSTCQKKFEENPAEECGSIIKALRWDKTWRVLTYKRAKEMEAK